MSVMTVLGPVEVDNLGTTLSHEHCFVDIRHLFAEPEEMSKKILGNQQVAIHNLNIVKSNPFAIKDNLLLSDFEVTRQELEEFKKAGGKTIVDVTPRGIGRDPYLLRSLAISTGLNIIAGSGYYTQNTHPKQVDEKSVEELADELVEDLTEGIGKTNMRAGVIGELGTSEKIHPSEKKVLLAAAEAHNRTGAPIYIHVYSWAPNGVEVVNIFSKKGVQLDKLVICHVDSSIDMKYIKNVLSTGTLVEFDNFGKEFYVIPEDRIGFYGLYGGVFSTDRERVEAIKELVDEGFEKQILISNDVCFKTDLQHYGGWGYNHVLRNIVPMMIEEKIDKATIDLFLKENPKKLLDIT